jgi:hypothetical protein
MSKTTQLQTHTLEPSWHASRQFEVNWPDDWFLGTLLFLSDMDVCLGVPCFLVLNSSVLFRLMHESLALSCSVLVIVLAATWA